MSEPANPAIGAPLVHHLASAAADRQFRLPRCLRCGQVQYPLREHCAACLSDELRWEPVAAGGRLLASTTVHHSNDPSFRPRLPLTIGSVRLDCGPVVIAFVRAFLPAGTPVIVHNRLDPSGAAVLVALTEHDPLENE
ncbi:MAG TPA: OB-fold domain-containing protein [Burkholderiaceae bacterium]|nr:OB-fold domain-containing protein [Burkholderiaceae bacterium]